MYTCAPTTDTQRSGGQTLGNCVCTQYVPVCGSWNPHTAGETGSWHLQSPQGLLFPFPVRGWRTQPHWARRRRCPGVEAADVWAPPLPSCCGATLVLLEQEGLLGGRVPRNWEVGVLGGVTATPPRRGGRGSSCAPHHMDSLGHAQPFHSSACRRCYGYRVACKGEGKGLGRTGFEDSRLV